MNIIVEVAIARQALSIYQYSLTYIHAFIHGIVGIVMRRLGLDDPEFVSRQEQ